MGAYLSEPNLKKESLDDDLGQLSYGASSMQGWRLEQEVKLNLKEHYLIGWSKMKDFYQKKLILYQNQKLLEVVAYFLLEKLNLRKMGVSF